MKWFVGWNSRVTPQIICFCPQTDLCNLSVEYFLCRFFHTNQATLSCFEFFGINAQKRYLSKKLLFFTSLFALKRWKKICHKATFKKWYKNPIFVKNFLCVLTYLGYKIDRKLFLALLKFLKCHFKTAVEKWKRPKYNVKLSRSKQDKAENSITISLLLKSLDKWWSGIIVKRRRCSERAKTDKSSTHENSVFLGVGKKISRESTKSFESSQLEKVSMWMSTKLFATKWHKPSQQFFFAFYTQSHKKLSTLEAFLSNVFIPLILYLVSDFCLNSVVRTMHDISFDSFLCTNRALSKQFTLPFYVFKWLLQDACTTQIYQAKFELCNTLLSK